MGSYCGDVLIHIDERLDDHDIHTIEYNLGQIDGVYCACVPERARHLLLVDYDPAGVEAAELLQHVRRHGVRAALVGL